MFKEQNNCININQNRGSKSNVDQNARSEEMRTKLHNFETNNWLKSRCLQKAQKKYLSYPEEQVIEKKLFNVFCTFLEQQKKQQQLDFQHQQSQSDNSHSIQRSKQKNENIEDEKILNLSDAHQIFKKYGYNLTNKQIILLYKSMNQSVDQGFNFQEFYKCLTVELQVNNKFQQITNQIARNRDISKQNQEEPEKIYKPKSFTSLINYLSYRIKRDILRDNINGMKSNNSINLLEQIKLFSQLFGYDNDMANLQQQNSRDNQRCQQPKKAATYSQRKSRYQDKNSTTDQTNQTSQNENNKGNNITSLAYLLPINSNNNITSIEKNVKNIQLNTSASVLISYESDQQLNPSTKENKSVEKQRSFQQNQFDTNYLLKQFKFLTSGQLLPHTIKHKYQTDMIKHSLDQADQIIKQQRKYSFEATKKQCNYDQNNNQTDLLSQSEINYELENLINQSIEQGKNEANCLFQKQISQELCKSQSYNFLNQLQKDSILINDTFQQQQYNSNFNQRNQEDVSKVIKNSSNYNNSSTNASENSPNQYSKKMQLPQLNSCKSNQKVKQFENLNKKIFNCNTQQVLTLNTDKSIDNQLQQVNDSKNTQDISLKTSNLYDNDNNNRNQVINNKQQQIAIGQNVFLREQQIARLQQRNNYLKFIDTCRNNGQKEQRKVSQIKKSEQIALMNKVQKIHAKWRGNTIQLIDSKSDEALLKRQQQEKVIYNKNLKDDELNVISQINQDINKQFFNNDCLKNINKDSNLVATGNKNDAIYKKIQNNDHHYYNNQVLKNQQKFKDQDILQKSIERQARMILKYGKQMRYNSNNNKTEEEDQSLLSTWQYFENTNASQQKIVNQSFFNNKIE